METKNGIVLFDGECNFCDATVQYIIKYDKKDRIRFTSQQSETGIKILHGKNIDNSLSTIYFFSNNKVYSKSDAIIEISSLLVGYPRVFTIMRIIPSKIRNYFYDKFSINRYYLFGKKTECMIPPPEIRKKFLN